jgi:hypothetical protein
MITNIAVDAPQVGVVSGENFFLDAQALKVV